MNVGHEIQVFSKVEKLSRLFRNLKAGIKRWRYELRKDKDKELDRIKHKIVAIDTMAEALDLDDETVKERVNLMMKITKIEDARIEDLKQKAKLRWTLEGDENSRFFHGVINQKFKNLRIHDQNINGVWISNPDRIKDEVRSFFKKKFKEEHPIRPKLRSGLFKRLSAEQREILEVTFEFEEVKVAVWICGNNKAPGPDGFSFEFIKKF